MTPDRIRAIRRLWAEDGDRIGAKLLRYREVSAYLPVSLPGFGPVPSDHPEASCIRANLVTFRRETACLWDRHYMRVTCEGLELARLEIPRT